MQDARSKDAEKWFFVDFFVRTAIHLYLEQHVDAAACSKGSVQSLHAHPSLAQMLKEADDVLQHAKVEGDRYLPANSFWRRVYIRAQAAAAFMSVSGQTYDELTHLIPASRRKPSASSGSAEGSAPSKKKSPSSSASHDNRYATEDSTTNPLAAVDLLYVPWEDKSRTAACAAWATPKVLFDQISSSKQHGDSASDSGSKLTVRPIYERVMNAMRRERSVFLDTEAPGWEEGANLGSALRVAVGYAKQNYRMTDFMQDMLEEGDVTFGSFM